MAATALERVREAHKKNASRDADRAHIITRRKELNTARAGQPNAPALPQDIMQELGPGDEGISGSDEKGAQLPPLPISPVVAPSLPLNRSGLEETVDDLPIVLITNYQPQGAKREDLLNVLAEWAAKLVDDKVRLPLLTISSG